MNSTKSMFVILLSAFLVLALVSFKATTPANTYAHPALNLTPEPEPRPPDDDGDGNNGGSDTGQRNPGHPDDDDDDDDDSSSTVTDFIDVQLGDCGLDESIANTNQAGVLLADGGSDVALLAAPPVPSLPEVLAPVQLVHQGSGWIATGTLSSQATTRFMVPYPGRWNVLLTTPPKFNTAELVDVTGLNLADLQFNLSSGPLALGTVEANVTQTQSVACPITRVSTGETAVVVPVVEDTDPAYLPITGQSSLDEPLTTSTILMVNLVLVGLMIFWGYRGLRSNRN